jgi:hypothetical protein
VTGRSPKVLFIAGSGRSGTTILHNVLGQIDGLFAAGELRELWLRGAVKDRMCSCQSSFRSCPTWGTIMDHAFGPLEEHEARETARLIESFRIHQLPRTWVPRLRHHDLQRRAKLLARLRRLYVAIGEVTGCRVIVDSSKNPSYGYLLAHAGVGELDVLHVVRDARAAAYSWGQRKAFEPGRMMRRRSRTCASTVVHAVFGNAVRFQSGDIRLRPDERWRTETDRRDALAVAALTAPLRARYGYGRRDRPDRAAA